MQRNASATWKGNLKEGKGTIETQSRVLSETPYSFTTRFEKAPGTNPEELVAAAHAACFSMALSATLSEQNLTPDAIHTSASLTLEKNEAGWSITRIHLEVLGKVPKTDQATFEAAANKAKETCPISRLLNTNITMEARLENSSRKE
ncbi:OsmC family protein [Candidatus Peregrinibacteria bacterium]|nr:OsmC family protein [Candidatus Peregrinibacteria bacterium]